MYDVNELAGALQDDEWARFERVVSETINLNIMFPYAEKHYVTIHLTCASEAIAMASGAIKSQKMREECRRTVGD